MYYCTNIDEGIIKDYIGVRPINRYAEGFAVGGETIVLAPTEGSWDSVNVCDPSVIRGSFAYNGNNYEYLMAYLGCDTTDCQKNSVGLAVSNYPDREFIKVGNAPIVRYDYDYAHTDRFQWGAGQPSLINLGWNKVALFYTVGNWDRTYTRLDIYDMSGLNDPVLLGRKEVSDKGVGHSIHNADFAMDGGYLYMICDGNRYSGTNLNIIPDTSEIYRCAIDSDLDRIDSVSWEAVGTMDAYEKNHNCGFIRTASGNRLTDCVAVTSAEEKDRFIDSLATYSIRFVPMP